MNRVLWWIVIVRRTMRSRSPLASGPAWIRRFVAARRAPTIWFPILCLVLPALPLGSAQSQTRPQVDHHQHLFSPATVALVSPRPLPPIDLPPDLDGVIQARARDARDVSALRALYTDDAWLVQPSTGPSWIRGRDAVVASVSQSGTTPHRLTPVGSAVGDSAGYITAYVTEGRGDSTKHVGYALLSLRKGSDARWRIAAEAHTPAGPSVQAIAATDLIRLLDAAGIRRALVFSMAYTWGSPNRVVENEYEKVRAENDWTSREVARFPDRLRAFCSFNPLKPYALDELARCANDPHLRSGLKLHLANSVVDLHDAQHIEQLRRVFRAANGNRMPIVVHLRSSLSRGLPYGRAEARIFLNEVVPAAPDVPVQIAHLAGAGGYDDPTTDEALAVFAEAIAKRDPHTRRLYFDISGVVGPGLSLSVQKAALVAERIRQLGLERILVGSDAATGGNLAPREAWVAFRQLPLTDAEVRTIASNVAPYMR